ncbi:Trp biosynthesis-associated membrane protein [Sanguibacter suarezii]|uniref:Trp biosynthesis-associated membrane protein n=1 Tax=Sanguibacter suarezii TaxID=60921 RepID=UPI0008362E68|nr:Trp biosynthesis-associated membrane protein [Sanguibacter suarezii]
MSGAARGGRRQIVLPLVVLGGAAVATAAPTWLTTIASTVLDEQVTVTVTGTTAAPGVSAAALVVVAAALALGLVGRVARWIALAVVALGGVVIAGSALNIIREPEAAARTGVAEATGVIGVVGDVSVSVAPYLTLLCGVAIMAVVVRSIVAPINWGSRTTKYDTPATGAGAGAGAGAGETGGAGAGPRTTGAQSAPRPAGDSADGHTPAVAGTAPDDEPALDERDAWDALTQGEDPS